METIPNDLTNAARAARERLTGFSREAATAGTSESRPAAQRVMAAVAREAIFADAFTAAIHARLEELKGVAK